MRWIILALLLSGCVYTPEKKVAYTEILRPNGDGDLVQCTTFGPILDELAAPPASPTNNYYYLVKVGATGAWTGWDNYLACYQSGVWNQTIISTTQIINIESTGAKYQGSTAAGWTPVTTSYYTYINEDVGELGDITGVDTTRIASWGGDFFGIRKIGPYSESPTTLVKSQDVLWSNYTGHASHRIKYLTFRWAATGSYIGDPGELYAYCDVYLNGTLVERFNLTAPCGELIGMSGCPYGVREYEVVLDKFYTPAEIGTLRTRLVSRSTVPVTLYALECHTLTSEKETEKDINPSDGGEKVINPSVSLEKP